MLQIQYCRAFLGDLLHSSLTTPWWTSNSSWSVPPETIKHWVYCTLMSKKCTAPQPFLYLADQITTWFTSCHNINPNPTGKHWLIHLVRTSRGSHTPSQDTSIYVWTMLFAAQTVTCFPNNKPWMTTDIKVLPWMKKNRAFCNYVSKFCTLRGNHGDEHHHILAIKWATVQYLNSTLNHWSNAGMDQSEDWIWECYCWKCWISVEVIFPNITNVLLSL